MKSKIFWITVIFLLSFIFFRGKSKKKKLLQNIEYAQGYVIKVRAGVVTGGGIQFRIIDRETNYNLLMPWGVECESKVKEMLLNLSNKKFPVVYDSTDVQNAEILLFKSQYEKYGVQIPEALKELINKLSECE
jgi:hypothetical protein